MLLHTFTNILVKKLFGNNLVGRFVKYLIKSLYYTLLPSAKCTRPLFQGRTGCGWRPSGWHDIITCQHLVYPVLLILHSRLTHLVTSTYCQFILKGQLLQETARRLVSLNLCVTPSPLVKGNIFVADADASV